jgi:thymidylate synthase
MPIYRNISFATAGSVVDVLDHGSDVIVRGMATREVVGRVTTLDRPLERYLFLPKRHNHVFAQFAETMWVLAGRNDIAWLARYLSRAPDYSDDGQTWHGAYGPWAGHVDQLDNVRRLLSVDLASRRAVMSLFDPERDFADSKDIPCNNWLSWIAREGKLHLSVAIRSNDAMWGFSGVNAFEWSILQEVMAYWLSLDVGAARYFAHSFHLYDHHSKRARQIDEGFHGLTPYDFGVGRAAFQTSWSDFPARLERWFALEEQIRTSRKAPFSFMAGQKIRFWTAVLRWYKSIGRTSCGALTAWGRSSPLFPPMTTLLQFMSNSAGLIPTSCRMSHSRRSHAFSTPAAIGPRTFPMRSGPQSNVFMHTKTEPTAAHGSAAASWSVFFRTLPGSLTAWKPSLPPARQ